MGPDKNRADGVLEALLQGRDVRIYLKPDASVENRAGSESYIEALDLPHIIVKNDAFWACQRSLLLTRSAGPLITSFYSYYSGFDLFSSSAYLSVQEATERKPQVSHIMSTGRYEALGWSTHGTADLVYDSAVAPERLDDYIAAIHDGARFKAAISQSDGTVQIHPVMYPFYFPDADRLDVQTEVQFFPDYMRYGPDELRRLTLGDAADRLLDFRSDSAREATVTLRTPFFSSYFRLFNGATGHRIYDVQSERLTTFERIRLFALA